MDVDENGDPLFPFDRLVTEIQSRVLACLPISTLVCCKAVSRTWRALIRSPQFIAAYPRCDRRDDVVFLLFSNTGGRLSPDDHGPHLIGAYLPSRDRWFDVLLPAPVIRVISTATSLVLAGLADYQIAVYRPFTNTPPSFVPRTDSRPTFLSLFEEGPHHRVVALSVHSGIPSQVYSSASNLWEPYPTLIGETGVLGMVQLNAHFACLTSSGSFLTFSADGGRWNNFRFQLPPPSNSLCPHIIAFRGRAYMVDVGASIRIWELSPAASHWELYDTMPESHLSQFTAHWNGLMQNFKIVDRLGIVAFYDCGADRLLMYDMVKKSWWWSDISDVYTFRCVWLGHAIQLPIDLLN